VGVANEGLPFIATARQSMLVQRPRLNVEVAGEYYTIPCPFCRDTRQRLWVNHMFGQVGHDGWPMKFLAICYNESCLTQGTNQQKLYDLIYGFRNASERGNNLFGVRESETTAEEAVTVREASPPGVVLPLADLYVSNPNHPALQYMLVERQYTLDSLRQWGAGYCSSASDRYATAAGRIIFPVWFNSQYVGWQGRHLGELSNWKTTPKYYTMPGLKKQRILYNFDVASQCPCVVITEGLTDVHRIGNPGVATMGSSLSQQQAQLLAVNCAGKPIVLLYDPEAVEETAIALQRLTAACSQSPVLSVRLPDGTDPGSLPREVNWSIIVSQCSARGVRITAPS